MTFILSLPLKVSVPLVLVGAFIAFMLVKIIIHACVHTFWECVKEIGFRAHIASGYLADGATLIVTFILESISLLATRAWSRSRNGYGFDEWSRYVASLITNPPQHLQNRTIHTTKR